MWKAYGSFTPSDRGDDGLCRTIGEFQYINQLKFSQKSVLIKPIRLLEFSWAKFLLIERTGCKNDFAYKRGGEGKLYASNMLPRSKQKNVRNLPQFGKMQTV